MKHNTYVLKGDICYSVSPREVKTAQDGYLVYKEGKVVGVFETLPAAYAEAPLADFSGYLITPGLVDLHLHAPQYSFRSLGMDLELLDWLNANTFPEESKFQNLSYAGKSYRRFVEDLRRGFTTRACMFGTIHTDATLLLMDLLEESGLCTAVGKVNMDRNSPDTLREESAEKSAADTRAWLEAVKGRYQRTTPVLTPRFTPSCTDELMTLLGEIQREYRIPVQSHLSENLGEIQWVRELCPNTKFYGEAYDQFGLFGGKDCPTIMAHCVHSPDEEIALMKERGVFVAHCPGSNADLSSGIAPVRRYLDEGLSVGLGSDIAGGHDPSIFRAMSDAVQFSKLRWRLVDTSLNPLTVPEAFYLGTMGGGAFFGKVGTFTEGYEMDALIIDDSRYDPRGEFTVAQRLERTVYLSREEDLCHKFVRGRQLF